ncbi:MAG: transglutaminase family protein [Puniceicoccaceae bacterium]
MLTERDKSCLERLIDDESSVVRGALVERLRVDGEEAIAFLRRLARSADRLTSKHIHHILLEIGSDDPVENFRRYIQSCRYDLESGCLLLERALNPSVDMLAVSRFVDGMAARVDEFVKGEMSPFERCKVINRVMFHDYGFSGDVETFENPANSLLSRVIERRRGIPISLSTLYLLAAWRCGFNLEPIGLPGRFCLGCFEGSEPFFIDPFERGAFRVEAEILQYLRDHDLGDAACYLMPSPVGEILHRYCLNLAEQYRVAGDAENRALVKGFISEFEAVYDRDEG